MGGWNYTVSRFVRGNTKDMRYGIVTGQHRRFSCPGCDMNAKYIVSGSRAWYIANEVYHVQTVNHN